MIPSLDRSQITQSLLQINQLTFENEEFQTAYYGLVTAFHFACEGEDLAALHTIEQTADQQGDWLETHYSTNPKFLKSSFKRIGFQLYKVLAHQAKVQITLIRRQQTRHPQQGQDA